ncbi:hypothetical protein [Streptomyces sp. 8N616]|uniref:hypothetical protein n=1 Tax=Streptomyces sp. 8N616 TaxID=3457414 RepID=UPI003FCF073B
MNVGGIDEEAARKAGNKVRIEGDEKVLIDGKTGAEIARIPADADQAREQALSPRNVVTGNCGLSYFFLQDDPNPQQYEWITGFIVNGSAYDFAWYVNTRGEWDSGVYNYEWEDVGPMWPDSEWSSEIQTDDTTAPGGTYHYGRVTSGTAYLVDGRVCFSGYPNHSDYVY